MPEKFKNKYRIPSARLQNWDYRWHGAYFITICTQNRENYFGNVVDGKMELSAIGIIADIMWHEIKNHETNHTQIFHRNPVLFQPLFVPTNRRFPNMRIVWDSILDGKPGFMTTLFAMENHLKILEIISLKIP